MDKKLRLLDCTLRDGAYIVNAKFGAPAMRGIIGKLQDANVDIIECGWLKNNRHEPGTSFYHIPSDLMAYLQERRSDVTYTVMIDWDRYDLNYLPEFDGKSIDAVRVVFPYAHYQEGVDVGRQIKEKGYQVFFQAANTLAYSNDDLRKLAAAINSVRPVSLSVVDTFGAMYEEDLDRIISVLDKELDPGIQLGFHSHNNQQMSFSLTIHFIKKMADSPRRIIVDSSLCGMGRGAGNATTELLVSYLNRKCGGHYDMDAVMDAIDVYMGYFKERYEWGYSTPYFIAGMYCCHVNNIAYLLENHRTNARDMRNIIESLSPDDRKKYDYDLLERKYIENQNRNLDDSASLEQLSGILRDRTVLLVAPGKSALTRKSEVDAFIGRENPFVLGVNAILPEYDYDSVLFVNSARYDYAARADQERFNRFPHIVTSNIKTDPAQKETIVAFRTVIKRGWEHYDNAVICTLRLLERLGVSKVAIAGFDGFKAQYNESYADPYLPTLNPSNEWEALNVEIKEIFEDFKRSAGACKDILFVTPSLFDGTERGAVE